jgi:acetyltransferase-like isoleucine patch superfamily enzyme
MRHLFYGMIAVYRKARTLWYTLLLNLKLRLLGAKLAGRVIFSGPIDLSLHWTAQLSIGRDCMINSGFTVNPVGGYRKTGIYLGPGANLAIGNASGISNSTIVCLQKIEIQDHVFIGGGCQIYDTDFHSLDEKLRGTSLDRPENRPVILKEGCFVGGHSLILKGVVIGRGAVIGAGSVVTHSVPDYEIWAGNPAKFIRKQS